MLACCTVLCSSAKAKPVVAILPDKHRLVAKGDVPPVASKADCDDSCPVGVKAPKTSPGDRQEPHGTPQATPALRAGSIREQDHLHAASAPRCGPGASPRAGAARAESVLGDIGGAWRPADRRGEAAPSRPCDQPKAASAGRRPPRLEDEAAPAQQGAGGFRQRAQSLGTQLLLDDLGTQPSVGRAWSEDIWGTILHKPSGLRISPVKGIEVNGVQYNLSPEDLEFSEEGVLGAGSGGVVHVGLHRPSGERVAVKTLRVSDDDANREQMLKEIMSLAQIAGCPYVIQWYAGFADTAKGCVHVVLEYMDRGSLADLRRRLAGRGLPPEHVACVAAQVLRGLRHLQSRRLLHRDVKPENILHNHCGRVKLTDFGISKDLARLPQCLSSTFVGTATYMAPERAGGGDYSFESDVWSAGMVLYELATGSYPFPSASFVELYQGLCEGPEPRLEADAFPAPLRALVASCLTRSPAERPDAAVLCEREPVAGVGDEDVGAFAAWLAKLPV